MSNLNISESTAGKTVYTCMLNKKGGIEADLTVSALDDQGWDGTSPLYPVRETRFDIDTKCLGVRIIQGGDIGWPTGYGKKLSISQA